MISTFGQTPFIMKTVAFLLGALGAFGVSADIATDVFQKRVDPLNADEPHRYVHTAHIRTGLGRVTHFHYDAKKHDKLIGKILTTDAPSPVATMLNTTRVVEFAI